MRGRSSAFLYSFFGLMILFVYNNCTVSKKLTFESPQVAPNYFANESLHIDKKNVKFMGDFEHPTPILKEILQSNNIEHLSAQRVLSNPKSGLYSLALSFSSNSEKREPAHTWLEAIPVSIDIKPATHLHYSIFSALPAFRFGAVSLKIVDIQKDGSDGKSFEYLHTIEGVTDQNGISVKPRAQGVANTTNSSTRYRDIHVNLGNKLDGKRIKSILVGIDLPEGNGPGIVNFDDIVIEEL